MSGEYVGAPLRSAPLSNLTPPLTSAVPTNSLIRAPTHRAAIHDLLNRPSSSRAALVVHWLILGAILVSTLCFVLQSEPEMASWPGWRHIDALVAVGFTAEYITRIIVAPDGRGDEAAEEDGRRQPPPASACQARLRLAKQPMMVIDLAAILPFWIGLVLFFLPQAFLAMVRVLRLVRILRLLRFAKESSELQALAACVRRCLPALRLLLFFLLLQNLILGGFVFHAEAGAFVAGGSPGGGVWVVGAECEGRVEPGWEEEEGGECRLAPFQSVRDGIWWALVTVTTVGYGELKPRCGRDVAEMWPRSRYWTGLAQAISCLSRRRAGSWGRWRC